jgi:lactate dehydrogenase-like 2-hydroxyacid dehydrogenase
MIKMSPKEKKVEFCVSLHGLGNTLSKNNISQLTNSNIEGLMFNVCAVMARELVAKEDVAEVSVLLALDLLKNLTENPQDLIKENFENLDKLIAKYDIDLKGDTK